VLYAASAYGGIFNASCALGCGTLFAIMPPSMPGGTRVGKRLHAFNGSDESTPFGTLVSGPGGAIYGTTYNGGASNYGTVFQLTP
jgi:uncharacterized repeat protein (TIGR03803 family)